MVSWRVALFARLIVVGPFASRLSARRRRPAARAVGPLGTNLPDPDTLELRWDE
jgi:hypothetical protein